MGARNILRLLNDALVAGFKWEIGSGETVKLLPLVDDQGKFEVGNGTTDADVKIFLGATTKTVEFNVGDSQINLEDVDLHVGDNDSIEIGDATLGDIAFKWNGSYLQSGPPTGMWANAPSPLDTDPSVASFYFTDFTDLDTTFDWQETSDGTPGFAVANSDTLSGGWVSVSTQPSTPLNNNEVYVSSLPQSWVFLEGKKLWFEIQLNLTEANVDDSNIIVGLSDTVGTNTLLDDGGGPAASYDGAVLFKVDGGVVWQVETSNAGTQATDSSAGAFTSATTQTLGFFFDGTATTSTIEFWVNGVSQGAQDITLSGLQAMHILFGIKCGADTQIETLLVNYVKIVQLR